MDRGSGAQVFTDISGESAAPDQPEPVAGEPTPKRVRFSTPDEEGDLELDEADHDSARPGDDFSRRSCGQEIGSRRSSLDAAQYGPLTQVGLGRAQRRRSASTAAAASAVGGDNKLPKEPEDDDPTLFDFLRQDQQAAASVPVPKANEGDKDLQVELDKDDFEVHLLETLEAYVTDIEEDLATLKETDALIAQTGAIKVYTGPEAELMRKNIDPSRILKSRFVKTRRQNPKIPGKSELKARWCVKGYLDPDVYELNQQAPTLSGDGLAMVLQMISSQGWVLEIADVGGLSPGKATSKRKQPRLRGDAS